MKDKVILDGTFKAPVKGRYVSLFHVEKLLEELPDSCRVTIEGYSEQGRPVYMVSLGHGPKKVLAWSQMHGNETTTTRAVLDLLAFLTHPNSPKDLCDAFLNQYTLTVFPILNPDGALAYTRENANGVDLNRDAVDLSQAESLVLDKSLRRLEPDLCLNLHDQRTIYGLPGGKPATISFLAPSADAEGTITAARKSAMELIVKMYNELQGVVPGQIGRYDDTYNPHCVGDKCSELGIPTILIEAGHYPGDYQREGTRKLVYRALLVLFGLLPGKEGNSRDYLSIPQNQDRMRDVVIRDCMLPQSDLPQDLAIQYREVLDDMEIRFVPELDALGNLDALEGLRELSAAGKPVLINNQTKTTIGMKIARIVTDTPDKEVLFLGN